MFSAQYATRRLALTATILIGLAAGTAASADALKPADIEESRQGCMVSCIQQKGDSDWCTAFCDCNAKGLGEQITQEEYDAGKVALSTQQKPAEATVEKLVAISKACKAKMP